VTSFILSKYAASIADPKDKTHGHILKFLSTMASYKFTIAEWQQFLGMFTRENQNSSLLKTLLRMARTGNAPTFVEFDRTRHRYSACVSCVVWRWYPTDTLFCYDRGYECVRVPSVMDGQKWPASSTLMLWACVRSFRTDAPSDSAASTDDAGSDASSLSGSSSFSLPTPISSTTASSVSFSSSSTSTNPFDIPSPSALPRSRSQSSVANPFGASPSSAGAEPHGNPFDTAYSSAPSTASDNPFDAPPAPEEAAAEVQRPWNGVHLFNLKSDDGGETPSLNISGMCAHSSGEWVEWMKG
jgi:hypothetical protein